MLKNPLKLFKEVDLVKIEKKRHNKRKKEEKLIKRKLKVSIILMFVDKNRK